MLVLKNDDDFEKTLLQSTFSNCYLYKGYFFMSVAFFILPQKYTTRCDMLSVTKIIPRPFC